MRGAALIPIQDGGYSRVRFDPRQRVNDLHEILVGGIPMFAAANLLELHLGVIPSLPMQHESYGSPSHVAMISFNAMRAAASCAPANYVDPPRV